MLDARELKSQDELMLLNSSASIVDGTYQKIAEALKPGVRESETVALANYDLYSMGSDCVGGRRMCHGCAMTPAMLPRAGRFAQVGSRAARAGEADP